MASFWAIFFFGASLLLLLLPLPSLLFFIVSPYYLLFTLRFALLICEFLFVVTNAMVVLLFVCRGYCLLQAIGFSKLCLRCASAFCFVFGLLLPVVPPTASGIVSPPSDSSSVRKCQPFQNAPFLKLLVFFF